MYTGIRDLLCLPARKPSAAHRACQGPCVVRVPPLPSLPLACCPWKQRQAPTEYFFMETSGPSASWRHLGLAFFLVLPKGVFSTSVRWCLVRALWFSSALQGSGLPAGSLGRDAPWHTAPHTLGWLCGSQCCAGPGEGAAQPPLPPSLPA